jgi:hypothetical protein
MNTLARLGWGGLVPVGPWSGPLANYAPGYGYTVYLGHAVACPDCVPEPEGASN